MYLSNLVELLYILACLLTAHYTLVWLIVVGLGSFACTVLVVGGMNVVVYSCGPFVGGGGHGAVCSYGSFAGGGVHLVVP